MSGRIVFALLALAALMTLWPFATSADAGGGCRGLPVTEVTTNAVRLSEMPCFAPEIVHVRAGDTVTWTNEGLLAHTVTGQNASWGDYSELGDGDSVSHRFDAAGVYPYYCLLHPGMVGAVVVTGGDGSLAGASASLAGAGVDGLSRDAASTADKRGSNGAMIALYGAIAIAAAVGTGAAGFALGRRR